MLNGLFWLAAGERAVKTAAQVVLTFLGADVINAFAVDYGHVAGIALGAAGVSAPVAGPQGDAKGTPSLVGE